MILLFILLILSSSGSIPVASKSPRRPPSFTNENPSPSLPTQPPQDNKPAQSRTNLSLPSQSNPARSTVPNHHIQPITSRRVAQAAHIITSTSNQLQPPVNEPAPSPPANQRATAINNMFSPARDTDPSPSSSAPAHPPPSSGGSRYERASHQSSFLMIPQDFQPPERPAHEPDRPINLPWYQTNPFLAIEGCLHAPNEFHRMDHLSLCVLNYFLMGGLSNTATWAQRPSLSNSLHIQCFLNQMAFSLFALAHLVFPRTRPVLAFIIDRLSFLLIVVSGYLSNMPMFPPYMAIIMLLLVSLVYIFSRFRG